MTTRTPLVEQRLLRTDAGRDITVTRYAPGALAPGGARLVLGTACLPYDRTELWAVLTVPEARRLAAVLTAAADLAEREEPS